MKSLASERVGASDFQSVAWHLDSICMGLLNFSTYRNAGSCNNTSIPNYSDLETKWPDRHQAALLGNVRTPNGTA